jgi:carboxypeptidase Taq
LPRFREHFPNHRRFDLDELWPALHTVVPSLIRVEADETTYNLHIVVRFELERQLFVGDLTVADLPDAWADAYEEMLGIPPSDVADGVLQDIHWSMGAFG